MKTNSTCQLWIIALVFVSLFSIVQTQGSHDYKRVCYFTNWSRYRDGLAKFTTDKINSTLCTHLIYAFGIFDDEGNLKKQEWADTNAYRDFSKLKVANPKLRTLLAIGGWNFDSEPFSNMTKNPVTRRTFVSSTVKFLRSNGFDGLDIDWEYPGVRGGRPQDKQNLVTLCKELKETFTAEARLTKQEPLLLTAAVPADAYKVQVGYDIAALNQYLDFINIMTYDFHGGWEDRTGQNSPLYPAPIYNGDHAKYNIRDAAKLWHDNGVPKHKLIIGLAGYGRTFTLTTPNDGLGAPAESGPRGPFTRSDGFWSYYEVCMDIFKDRNKERLGRVTYDTIQEVPYYVKGNLWVGYDNEQSMKAKAKWIRDNGFGGFMFWSLDLDDFNMMCSSTTKPYPLIHAAIDGMGKSQPVTAPTLEVKKQFPRVGSKSRVNTRLATTTTTMTTTTNGIQAPVTTSVPTKNPCPPSDRHFFPDPTNCGKYIDCYQGRQFSKSCPRGLHWDSKFKNCNWPALAKCKTG